MAVLVGFWINFIEEIKGSIKVLGYWCRDWWCCMVWVYYRRISTFVSISYWYITNKIINTKFVFYKYNEFEPDLLLVQYNTYFVNYY
jgi:hypothetical protein